MKIQISDPRPKTEVDLQTAYQNGYNQYPIDHPPPPDFDGVIEFFNYRNDVTFHIQFKRLDNQETIDYTLLPRTNILVRYRDLPADGIFYAATTVDGNYSCYTTSFRYMNDIVGATHDFKLLALTASFPGNTDFGDSYNFHYQYVTKMFQ